ncbi:membrane integrity-associated transporter subunit PqiC [Citrobacter freundii]|uniref:membrane integrity-associated transporter subunit PqiC n=1 Tax=Citrobacter freundii TaxID=546 RepID=UPI000738AD45|nr:membrane integrity-associated transporter subunit PqiC [Citrobacter freundii]MBM7194370.1 membrane integrity-associated transporter subunit PqiC [Citrobacter freundii]MBM7199731.1 membrane integrity-associated transporter subunit PqiC [Citrobacter freundii]MBM7207002.1 membrane integrity-associated transporter subunit PqiC [Citrobacter freundii]MBM7262165.1 membrane integrity-associated transporter subunit PqiC [Citrobacter freundii]QSB81073.1 membrane integrity-associated transporter subun
MKKWLVAMMAVWLTSCSSSGENKSYYQLPIAQGGVQSSANQGNRLLWVEQIAVPDYLAGNGVVYQTSDVQYVIANNNLWASPLDQQLRNTLVANLSMQLPGWVVASQPLGSTQDTLNVTVTGFHGRYDGKVIVSGEWLLNHQGQLIKRPFHIEAVQTKDGYDEMVKVLANAWSQEATAIAQELKRIP